LPQNDARPEYLVDEFFTITWAPEMTQLKIKRDPGITGRYGWTSREGFLEEAEQATE